MNGFSIMSVFAIVAGYLLGSLNSSLIVGKFYGVDVRQQGSGNAGTTNTLRVLGKKAAIMVLAGDLLKGVLSYLLGTLITGDPAGGLLAGTAAIIGHIWPVFFGFKGGKGVLTALAVLMMADWVNALIALAVFIVIVAVTRYVSLGSVIGAIVFTAGVFIAGRDMWHAAAAVVICVLIVFMHRSNIKRLMNGTESKLGSKKKDTTTGVANPEAGQVTADRVTVDAEDKSGEEGK